MADLQPFRFEPELFLVAYECTHLRTAVHYLMLDIGGVDSSLFRMFLTEQGSLAK